MATQHCLEVRRAGELVADRPGADVDHDRGAGVLEDPERRVQRGVVEGELADLSTSGTCAAKSRDQALR
jgi:hypothetical protein